MPLVINQSAHENQTAQQLIELCPFKAFDYVDGTLSINSSCRYCMQCVKSGPKGAISFMEEDNTPSEVIDKSMSRGICVVAEIKDSSISTVTFELLAKAKELASVIDHPVQVVVMGDNVGDTVNRLRNYADEVYVYDYPELEHFLPIPYAATLAEFITAYRPSTILVAATNSGRSLAPRVAARFKTGLTADCTKLAMHENTDLIQIRPAFGGNIMAEILTTNTRPQICTVRPGIFDIAATSTTTGQVYYPKISRELLRDECKVLEINMKPEFIDIADADVIVAAGRGVRNAAGLALVEELAKLLGAQTACTRPLVENGWFIPQRQIGLSGRTVKPKLLIACGISGSVQFAAGMNSSNRIVAINSDPNARIFGIAHYCVVGDIYEVLPRFISLLKGDNK